MPLSSDRSKTTPAPTQPTHPAGSPLPSSFNDSQHQPVSKPASGGFPRARTAGWAGKAGSNGNRPPPPQQRPSWPTEQAELTHHPAHLPIPYSSSSAPFRVGELYPSIQAGRLAGWQAGWQVYRADALTYKQPARQPPYLTIPNPPSLAPLRPALPKIVKIPTP